MTCIPSALPAQISLQTAITLSLQQSPRLKMAEDDAKRAAASLAELKAAYVPSLVGSSGLGASSGITLSVPTIFTVSAQSLVFNSSQRDYVRAGKMGLQALNFTQAGVRQQIEEDVIVTYLSLDNNRLRKMALATQYQYALDLVSIVQERFAAGYDNELELKKARRTLLEIKLQKSQIDSQIATLIEHLSGLTGIPHRSMLTTADSIPRAQLSSYLTPEVIAVCPDSPGTLSAQADAKAKLLQAFGDSRYTWRPQVALAAQYGRISPFNNVSTYYNLNGNYNTLAVGIQLQLPFLDQGRRAKGRETMAEASHAQHQLVSLRNQQTEDCVQIRESISQLETKKELTKLDLEIASDQLGDVLLQQGNGSGTSNALPMTPKDGQNARIQERQRYLDMLTAEEQLDEAKVHLLRQSGKLEEWVDSLAEQAPPIGRPSEIQTFSPR